MADNSTSAMDFTVLVDCSGGNGYDGRLGLRISSVFVIAAGSLFGMLSIDL
jgi:solute carrier family 39 (zinc transporter), member 1/2/3